MPAVGFLTSWMGAAMKVNRHPSLFPLKATWSQVLISANTDENDLTSNYPTLVSLTIQHTEKEKTKWGVLLFILF
jgi:hypothetical protein